LLAQAQPARRGGGGPASSNGRVRKKDSGRTLTPGEEYLRELRDRLEPVYEDQRNGLDSPLQPPFLYSHELSVIVRKKVDQKLRERVQEWAIIAKADSSVPKPHGIEVLAQVLSEITEGIISSYSTKVSEAGLSFSEVQMQRGLISSTRESKATFSREQMRAEAAGGKRVTVSFADEALELQVNFNATFQQLIKVAAPYWHLDPAHLIVADQDGVQYIMTTSVLEALKHTPNSRLVIQKIHRETVAARASQGEGIDEGAEGAHERERTERLHLLLKDAAKKAKKAKKKKEQDEGAEEDLELEVEASVKPCGYEAAPLSRTMMVVNFSLAFMVLVLLFAIAFNWLGGGIKPVEQYTMCTAIKAAANTPYELAGNENLANSGKGGGKAGQYTSLNRVHNTKTVYEFLRQGLPRMLYDDLFNKGEIAQQIQKRAEEEAGGVYAEEEAGGGVSFQDRTNTTRGKCRGCPRAGAHLAISLPGKRYVIMGGIRIMQSRAEVSEDVDLCSPAYFMAARTPFPWSNGTSAIPLHRVLFPPYDLQVRVRELIERMANNTEMQVALQSLNTTAYGAEEAPDRYWALQNLIGLFGGDDEIDVGFSLDPALDSSKIGYNTPANPGYNPLLPSCFFPSTAIQGDVIADARKYKEAANQCYGSTGGGKGSYGPVVSPREALSPDDILYKSTLYHQQKAMQTTIVEAECFPECPPRMKFKNTLSKAFVHHDASQIGNPKAGLRRTLNAKYEEVNKGGGGFGLTLPSNVSLPELDLALVNLEYYQWVDGQTRAISIELPFYAPLTGYVAHYMITFAITQAGNVRVYQDCWAGDLNDNVGGVAEFCSRFWAELFLFVWFLFRISLKFITMGRKMMYAKPDIAMAHYVAGETTVRPSHFTWTPDLIVNISIAIFSTAGFAFRLLSVFEQNSLAEQTKSWPPPFMTQLPYVLFLTDYCRCLYAFALFFTVIRLMMYYSIISTRMYVIRTTMVNAMYKLIPAVVMLVLAMMSYTLGANLLFPNAESFSSISSSMYTIVYCLRRPMGMPLEAMGESSLLWDSTEEALLTEPNLSLVLFFASYTIIVPWILSNLYKAIIINEFSAMALKYETKRPHDLTADPWPSLNFVKHAEVAARNARTKTMLRKSAREQKKKVLLGIALQKQKQAKLIKVQNDKFEELKVAEEERGDA